MMTVIPAKGGGGGGTEEISGCVISGPVKATEPTQEGGQGTEYSSSAARARITNRGRAAASSFLFSFILIIPKYPVVTDIPPTGIFT